MIVNWRRERSEISPFILLGSVFWEVETGVFSIQCDQQISSVKDYRIIIRDIQD